jgi:hypothetical protein
MEKIGGDKQTARERERREKVGGKEVKDTKFREGKIFFSPSFEGSQAVLTRPSVSGTFERG